MPLSQSVQTVALAAATATEYVVLGQSVQNVNSVSSLYFPAGHASQYSNVDVADVFVEYPALHVQLSRDVEPLDEVEFGQAVQCVDFCDEYVFSGHSSHRNAAS